MEDWDHGKNLWALARKGVAEGVYSNDRVALAVLGDALAVAALMDALAVAARELGLSRDEVLNGLSERMNARGVRL